MIIIDNTYKKLNCKTRGRKPKFKLAKNGEKFFFKYGAINYEIWAELIAEQLGLQAGIDMAHYEIASCNGVVGVLTNDFVKSGEFIISSDNLKEAVQSIFDENNLEGDLRDNTILNIVQAVYVYDPNTNSKNLSYELMKRWAFYGLIMESDKNETNIGFIKNNNGIHLAPDYDNSSMARLNEDINGLIDAMRHGHDIFALTDNITNDLKITEKDTKNFLENFDTFVKKYPTQASKIMESFNNINVEEAIKKVEDINDVDVPWEVEYWLSITINRRLEDMKNIYEQTLKQSKIPF